MQQFKDEMLTGGTYSEVSAWRYTEKRRLYGGRALRAVPVFRQTIRDETAEGIRAAAELALRGWQERKAYRALLGDYPPKRLP